MTNNGYDRKMQLGMDNWFHAALKEVAKSQYRAMNVVLRLTFEERYQEICDKYKKEFIPEFAEEKRIEAERIAKEEKRIALRKRADELNEIALSEMELDEDEFDDDL